MIHLALAIDSAHKKVLEFLATKQGARNDGEFYVLLRFYCIVFSLCHIV